MSRKLRVLLVENSSNDALLIGHTLEKAGIFSHRVENLESLAHEQEAGPWDCILTDFDLGAIDAFDVIDAVRRRDFDIPIVVVTGAVGEEQAVAMLRSGAQNYVMKDNLIRLPSVVRRETEDTGVRRAKREAEESLRESEARYRRVVEDLLEFVVRWRPDGSLMFANAAVVDLLDFANQGEAWPAFTGLEIEEGEGTPTPSLRHPTIDDRVLSTEVRVESSAENHRWLEWAHRGIFDRQGRLVELQSVGRDVTEARAAAEAVKNRHTLLEALRDTASALNSTLDLDEVLDRILANIAGVIPHDASAIIFVEKNQARAVRIHGWETFGFDGREATIDISGAERRVFERLVGGGSPLVIEDTETDPLWTVELANLEWVRSFAAAPLFDEDRMMGVLALFSALPGHFQADHVQMLEGFAHHASTAARNARIFDLVLRNRRELQSLAVRAVAAQEEERKRISMELHDEVGQALTAIIVNSEVVRGQLSEKVDASLVARLEDTAQLAKETLRQIRGLSLRLRPSMLDDLGLEPAIRWLCERFAERMGVEVHLTVEGMGDRRMGSDLETALYRVVQEGLTNAASHAEATEIEVDLVREPHLLMLHVADDGRGFPEPVHGLPPVFESGLGLLGIRERMAALGGRFEIESEPGKGSSLKVMVPVEEVE